METLLDSNNLDNEEQVDMFWLGVLEESLERDHGDSIDQESRLDVPFSDLSDIPDFVVLVLGLELKQKF